MADNNNNQRSSSSSKDKGKCREDAGVSSGAQSGQRDRMRRRGDFQSSQSSSQRPADHGSSSSTPTTMFHGATRLPKGDLELETTESEIGFTGFGFVDPKGRKPKSVVASLDIPGCFLAMGGVDDSEKAMLEAWRLFRAERPDQQISWMLFFDEGNEVETPPRGSKRGRDVHTETDDSEARPTKTAKLPAPKQPARPENARDPRSNQSRDAVTMVMNDIRLTREKKADGTEVWAEPEEDSDEDDEAFLSAATKYDLKNKA